jgi:transcription initiation factor TFIIH subunit 4
MSSSSLLTNASTSAFERFFNELSLKRINALYEISPQACLAVVRALSPVQKQILMRIVFLPKNTALSLKTFKEWHRNNNSNNNNNNNNNNRCCDQEVVNRLIALRTIVKCDDRTNTDDDDDDDVWFKVNESFRRHVRESLENGFSDLDDDYVDAEERRNGTSDNNHDHKKKNEFMDRTFLDSYAKGRWEDVLLELTSEASEEKRKKAKHKRRKMSNDNHDTNSLHLRKLFYASKLITKDGRITNDGFSFLLGATAEQIWILLARYAKGGDFERKNKKKNMDEGAKTKTSYAEVEVEDDADDKSSAAAMAFLVRLSFQHPGRRYSKQNLSEAERKVASHLSALGILYDGDDQSEDWYVPTVLSAGLSSVSTTLSAKSALARIDGHIIVETNFRVYAYTHSELETEVLRLFTRPDYKLPNAYVGMITRDSILDALRAGITPDQIVNYLQTRAHPRCTIGKKANHPSVPPTVCDQIRLWARDLYRVKAEDCVVYTDFPMQGEQFQNALENARKVNAEILWIDSEKKRFGIPASAHERLKVLM